MANIYVHHGGQRDGEIATHREVAAIGKFSPEFEIWTLTAAIEAMLDSPDFVAPRTAKIANGILISFANKGSERAARVLREIARKNLVMD